MEKVFAPLLTKKRGKNRGVPFATPQPQPHKYALSNDCYFKKIQKFML
jgi:hypothetical protein